MTEADLQAAAHRAARGDGTAFEAVCRALQDDVWRYCTAVAGDADLGAEATQDTFLRAVRAIRRFRGDAPVRLWLLVIARRATADVRARHVRHRDRHHRGEDVSEPAVGDGADRRALEALVADLPADLAQAFVLTQVVGLEYAEAAAVAGCPVGTIRSRVHRARGRLVLAVAESELAGGARAAEGVAGAHR